MSLNPTVRGSATQPVTRSLVLLQIACRVRSECPHIRPFGCFLDPLQDTRDRTAMVFVQAGKRVWIAGTVGLFYLYLTLGMSFEFYTPE